MHIVATSRARPSQRPRVNRHVGSASEPTHGSGNAAPGKSLVSERLSVSARDDTLRVAAPAPHGGCRSSRSEAGCHREWGAAP